MSNEIVGPDNVEIKNRSYGILSIALGPDVTMEVSLWVSACMAEVGGKIIDIIPTCAYNPYTDVDGIHLHINLTLRRDSGRRGLVDFTPFSIIIPAANVDSFSFSKATVCDCVFGLALMCIGIDSPLNKNRQPNFGRKFSTGIWMTDKAWGNYGRR